jgi:hypothetical protein
VFDWTRCREVAFADALISRNTRFLRLVERAIPKLATQQGPRGLRGVD